MYPWGWDGQEFETIIDADRMPYEVNIFREANSSVAARRGRKARRKQVQKILFKWILRDEIRWNIFGNTGSRSEQTPHQNHNLIPRIYINQSILGRRRTVGYRVTIDALSLIDLILNNVDTRGTKSKYDIADMERFLREQFELCDVSTKAELIVHYLDHANQLSDKGDDLPTEDTVRNYVDPLWDEYRMEE
jgi:hypothetical protein